MCSPSLLVKKASQSHTIFQFERNQITEIPVAIGNLVYLKTLWVRMVATFTHYVLTFSSRPAEWQSNCKAPRHHEQADCTAHT
jgi:hypothetical protein